MAEAEILEVKKRETRGSKAAHRLRTNKKEPRIPAVIYGHKEATESVSVPKDDLVRVLRHGARVLDLKSDKGLQKALIREVQFDHLGKEVLHIDFARVAADERIVVPVAIELRGIAPGVTGGGVLDQPLHSLEIECLAIAVPESIRVNITELQIGQSIHVRQLTLPPGVKAMNDPEAVVVHVSAPQAEVAAAPAEAGTAEPEVIGRKAAEEETEEKK
jgi:large subunit ribosomal protein L25